MTNHMAEVAQMLGVELEEVFKVTDDDSGKYHNYYKFTEKKGIEVSDDNVKWEAHTAGTLVLKWLLIGVARIIKLPWRPSRGDVYYMPSVTSIGKYIKLFWTGSRNDEGSYQQGLVLRTKKEAVELAEEMLDVARKKFAMAKEARDND